MYFKRFLYAAALSVVSMSCIQDEALNAECDILTCTLPESYVVSAPKIDNNGVTLYIQPDVDISRLAPEFTLTEGASLSPASGTAQDFLNAEGHIVKYTVVSQDGEWSKTYDVHVVQNEIPDEFYFNSTTLDNQNAKYPIFSEVRREDGEFQMAWASGNPGFVMCGRADVDAKAAYGNDYKTHIWEFFPTTAVYPEGTVLEKVEDTYHFKKDGKSACPEYLRLMTRTTGGFGTMVGMPIASGNIFQGFFDLSMAVAKPREATKFGEPYRYKPATLSGEYRYKAGAKFTDEKGREVAGKKDIFSVYAIFFESDENTEYISSEIHYNDFRHPNMVALAILEDAKESEEWASFSITFDYSRYGKPVDSEKLAKGKYKLGIVIASSAEGDYFRGAVGSTLDIRNIKMTHE